MNQFRASGVSPGEPAMFRPPMDDETKLGRGRNHFRSWRRQPETCAGYKSNQRNDGPPRPMTGDRHDQGSFRHRCRCVHRRRADRSCPALPPRSKPACRRRSPRATGSISAPSARIARSRPGRISKLPASAPPAPSRWSGKPAWLPPTAPHKDRRTDSKSPWQFAASTSQTGS